MKVLMISLILLSGCASTHSVTLGEFIIYGSNEQPIPVPEKQ